jgi:hypothetical protein
MRTYLHVYGQKSKEMINRVLHVFYGHHRSINSQNIWPSNQESGALRAANGGLCENPSSLQGGSRPVFKVSPLLSLSLSLSSGQSVSQRVPNDRPRSSSTDRSSPSQPALVANRSKLPNTIRPPRREIEAYHPQSALLADRLELLIRTPRSSPTDRSSHHGPPTVTLSIHPSTGRLWSVARESRWALIFCNSRRD